MFWSKTSRALGTVTAIVGGTVVGYIVNESKCEAQASWTTGYNPSCKWDWNWDRRDAKSLIKPSKLNGLNVEEEEKKLELVKPTASRHLIFIRHGQYNLEGATDEERSLTELGREQAALTGERLKALSLPYSRIVYSTMQRATETAKLIMEKIDVDDVSSCEFIREGAPIPPEPPVGHWKPEMYKFYHDGARIEAGFRRYFHRSPVSQEKDSYEVYVCHANVIRYFVCRALQLPPEAWLRMSLHNGSMTYMVIRPDGRVSIRLLGECGYMPPQKLSLT